MREFVIQSHKAEDNAIPGSRSRSGEAPPKSRQRYQTPLMRAMPMAQPAKTPGPRHQEGSGKPPGKKRHGNRSFVVSYKGAFVGFFEAEAELTPREAFVRIASDMAARDPAFEPGRLELYKPVLIKSARPSNGLEKLRGKLRCFSQKKRR